MTKASSPGRHSSCRAPRDCSLASRASTEHPSRLAAQAATCWPARPSGSGARRPTTCRRRRRRPSPIRRQSSPVVIYDAAKPLRPRFRRSSAKLADPATNLHPGPTYRGRACRGRTRYRPAERAVLTTIIAGRFEASGPLNGLAAQLALGWSPNGLFGARPPVESPAARGNKRAPGGQYGRSCRSCYTTTTMPPSPKSRRRQVSTTTTDRPTDRPTERDTRGPKQYDL